MCTQHANLGSDYTADFDLPSLLAEKWGLSYEIEVLWGSFFYIHQISAIYSLAINFEKKKRKNIYTSNTLKCKLYFFYELLM